MWKMISCNEETSMISEGVAGGGSLATLTFLWHTTADLKKTVFDFYAYNIHASLSNLSKHALLGKRLRTILIQINNLKTQNKQQKRKSDSSHYVESVRDSIAPFETVRFETRILNTHKSITDRNVFRLSCNSTVHNYNF